MTSELDTEDRPWKSRAENEAASCIYTPYDSPQRRMRYVQVTLLTSRTEQADWSQARQANSRRPVRTPEDCIWRN
jgi:hypothetical protein